LFLVALMSGAGRNETRRATMTTTTTKSPRLMAAERVVAAITTGEIETGRTWTASIWEGGQVLRIYLRKSGSDQGYITIDQDGECVGCARLPYVVSRALEAAGIETYR
jgi:hypothetical protein